MEQPIDQQEPNHITKDSPEKDNNSYPLAGAILLGAVLISGSIIYSARQFADKQPKFTQSQNVLGAQTKTQANPEAPKVAQVTVDDDPVMGRKDAPLTVIEFSDYECPFCKRSFNDIIPNLKKDYIDAGKVKFVYRDLPLAFHQNAHKEAQAAECARSQGGDSAYFKYHDQIFTRTNSNGTGLALDQLPVIAKDLGLNVDQFNQCLNSDRFKAEVDKDISDATVAGASGTPTWFIGKTTSSGVIQGTTVVGAQPYAAFKAIIDQQLK